MKETAMVGAAAAAMRSAGGAEGGKQAGAKLPAIRLGKLKVSRLILGSNPFFGFAHRGGKKLADAMRAYYTDERIMAVLDEAAALGVTAVAAPPYGRWIKLFGQYLEKGGKCRIWIAQPDPDPRQMRRAITASAKGGAKAIFIQGGRADEQFARKGFDTLRGWLDLIHSLGRPAGLASHRPDTHCEYERREMPADFYYQCFFQPVGGQYKMPQRDLAVAAIRKIEKKPVIGYKILAAGRIPAKEGFAFAFQHLRPKDGVCVGIYPPENAKMLAQDAALTAKLTQPPLTEADVPANYKKQIRRY
jgi:hypothetical protein